MGWVLFLIFLCIISFMAGWTTLGWIFVAFFVVAGIALIWASNENQKKQEEEDAHKAIETQILHDDGPREEEYGLDVEHQEEYGEEVVSHLELHPRASACGDTALVGFTLLGVVRTRRDGACDTQRYGHQCQSRQYNDH